jgi:hypothetical protein
MSRRAARAYDQGERPLTKWGKSDAADYEQLLARFGIDMRITLPEFRAILERFGETSWHHTSGMANRTRFYHPLATLDIDIDDLDNTDPRTVSPETVTDPDRARICAEHVADFMHEYRTDKDN